jgi:UPF0271 protein
MEKVDVNCDMGEGFGSAMGVVPFWKLQNDEEFMPYISSANIACGFHGGDADVMDVTVRMCKKYSVNVGAHPGHMDMQGFGMRVIQMPLQQQKNELIYQLGAMSGFCRVHGVKLVHHKTHGELPYRGLSEEEPSLAMIEATLEFDPEMILIAVANSMTYRMGKEKGCRVASEGYPEFLYTHDGIATIPAEFPDPVTTARRAVDLVKYEKAVCQDGTEVPLKVDTICIHGFVPGAIERLKAIKDAFGEEGIKMVPLKEIV